MPAKDFPLPDVKKYNDETWEYVVVWDYWHAYHMKALLYLERALDLLALGSSNEHKKAAENCINLYESILANHPGEPDYMFLNVGICYDHLRKYFSGDVGQKMAFKMLKNWKRYLDLSDPSDPSYRQVQDSLEQWEAFLIKEGIPIAYESW
jgi:hypothetical protein